MMNLRAGIDESALTSGKADGLPNFGLEKAEPKKICMV